MEVCKVLKGAIPHDLRGIYYRKGPDTSKGWYRSPLDGDGRVDRVQFGQERARLTSRVVETAHRRHEDEAGKVMYRHAFGTQPANPFRPLKNSANTGVAIHGGRLLATWEGGLPHELDPITLRTVGPHTVGGLVSPAPPFSTGSDSWDKVREHENRA